MRIAVEDGTLTRVDKSVDFRIEIACGFAESFECNKKQNFVGTTLYNKDSDNPLGLKHWSDIATIARSRLRSGQVIEIESELGLEHAATVAFVLKLEVDNVSRASALELLGQSSIMPINEDLTPRSFLVKASLLAGGIGDSLGKDLEFLSANEILRNFPKGVYELSETGFFSDDTQLTLFTAEALIRAAVAAPALSGSDTNILQLVHGAILRWGATQHIDLKIEDYGYQNTGLIADKRMWFSAAPGFTCTGAIAQALSLGAKANNKSRGCGTIMRVAPIAFGVPRHEIFDLAIKTSALTHGDAAGQLAAAVWAELLHEVSFGTGLRFAAEEQYTKLSKANDDPSKRVAHFLRQALDARPDGTIATVESIGSGWESDEALGIALYACLTARDLEHGLQISVVHSGDSDSTCSIAGNMLGLLYPDEIFDHRWLKQLGGADIISHIALDLAHSQHFTADLCHEISSIYPAE